MMYDLLIFEEMEHVIHDCYSICINGTDYLIEPHFSIKGKEDLLEQFAKILYKQTSGAGKTSV